MQGQHELHHISYMETKQVGALAKGPPLQQQHSHQTPSAELQLAAMHGQRAQPLHQPSCVTHVHAPPVLVAAHNETTHQQEHCQLQPGAQCQDSVQQDAPTNELSEH